MAAFVRVIAAGTSMAVGVVCVASFILFISFFRGLYDSQHVQRRLYSSDIMVLATPQIFNISELHFFDGIDCEFGSVDTHQQIQLTALLLRTCFVISKPAIQTTNS